VLDKGFKIFNAATVLTNAVPYFVVQDISITLTGSTTAVVVNSEGAGAIDYYKRLIIQAPNNAAGNYLVGGTSASCGHYFINCLGIGSGRAVYMQGWTGSDESILYNCTWIGGSSASFCVMRSFSHVNHTNNFVGNTTAARWYNNSGGFSNAADDNTPDGTNPIDNVSMTDGVNFTSPSTNDYTLVQGGALDGTVNTVVDMSSLYTDDITGNARDGWDVLSPDSGPLPAGLSVNATTGNIEGTPTESGTFPNIIIRGST
jgi:hypothetical protein